MEGDYHRINHQNHHQYFDKQASSLLITTANLKSSESRPDDTDKRSGAIDLASDLSPPTKGFKLLDSEDQHKEKGDCLKEEQLDDILNATDDHRPAH